jgi:diguanylate cyclase
MQYSEPAPRTGELLRLVLPRIAQSGGRYNPAAYGVWYEHLAGINPSLSQALESRLTQSPVIEQAEIDQLYARHIQRRDESASEKLQADLIELLRKLTAAAATSSDEAADYAKALSEGEQLLGSVVAAEDLQRAIRSLVDSTAAARTATDKLRSDLVASHAEMQSMREQLGSLQGAALKDPLTGLRNRRGLEHALEALLSDSCQGLAGAAILMVDIDHFKRVNDTYGHLFGDQVLRTCAQVLTRTVKGRDIVARFGGEEFLILLPDTAQDGALALAEQMRSAMGKVRIRRTGREELIEPVTVSIGVALPAPSESMDNVIERADQALYQAKNDGRNCVRLAAAVSLAAGTSLPPPAATSRDSIHSKT